MPDDIMSLAKRPDFFEMSEEAQIKVIEQMNSEFSDLSYDAQKIVLGKLQEARVQEEANPTPTKTFFQRAGEVAEEQGPRVLGGIAGGMIAASSGGTLLPVAGAVALGGGGGELARQGGKALVGAPDAPSSPEQAVGRAARAGAEEGALEVGGQVVMRGIGRVLAPFAKTVKPEAQKVIQAFKDKIKPILTPAEATDSRLLDIIENVGDSSLIGGGRFAEFREKRAKVLDNIAQDLVDQFGERLTPEEFGEMFVKAVNDKRETVKPVVSALYNKVSKIIESSAAKEWVEVAGESEAAKYIKGYSPKVAERYAKYMELPMDEIDEFANEFVSKNPKASFNKFYEHLSKWGRQKPDEITEGVADILYRKHYGKGGYKYSKFDVDSVNEYAYEFFSGKPHGTKVTFEEFAEFTDTIGRSPGTIPRDMAMAAYERYTKNGIVEHTMEATTFMEERTKGVAVPTASLKSFAKPLQSVSEELGSIERTAAGDDLIDTILEMPDHLSFDAAVELRSRLLARVQELSVINKNAPAVGKAKKLIQLIDGEVEKTLKGISRPASIPKLSRLEKGNIRRISEAFEDYSDKVWDGKLYRVGPSREGRTYFAVTRNDAEIYAEMYPGHKVKEFVPTGYGKMKVIELSEEQNLNTVLKLAGKTRKQYMEEVLDIAELVEDAMPALKKQGYDSILIKGMETPIEGQEVLAEVVILNDKLLKEAPVDSGGDALAAWRLANSFYKDTQSRFNSKLVRAMIKRAEDTRMGPETIGKMFFKPGNVTGIKQLKTILPTSDFQRVKGMFIQTLFDKASDTSGNIAGKRVLTLMEGKPNSYGLPMLREMFTEAEIDSLRTFGQAVKLSQERQAGGLGSMFIQLSQAGALVGVVAGAGVERESAAILITPAIMARAVLNPKIAKLLINGIKLPAHSPEAAGIMTRLTAAVLRAQHEAADDKHVKFDVVRRKPSRQSFDENKFQKWYKNIAAEYGLNPDPDDPRHYYDYREAYKAGAKPDSKGHWPSKFKKTGHPRTIVDGINTASGEVVNYAGMLGP